MYVYLEVCTSTRLYGGNIPAFKSSDCGRGVTGGWGQKTCSYVMFVTVCAANVLGSLSVVLLLLLSIFLLNDITIMDTTTL